VGKTGLFLVKGEGKKIASSHGNLHVNEKKKMTFKKRGEEPKGHILDHPSRTDKKKERIDFQLHLSTLCYHQDWEIGGERWGLVNT